MYVVISYPSACEGILVARDPADYYKKPHRLLSCLRLAELATVAWRTDSNAILSLIMRTAKKVFV